MQTGIKKVLSITNKYIVLATPLILFSLVSTIYLAVSANGKLINLLFGITLYFLMLTAFSAGWFSMVKTAISEDKEIAPNDLIKDFIPGVGEYFLPSLGLISNQLIFIIASLVISYYAGMHFIGDIGISAETFSKALETPETLKLFVSSLTLEQLSKINAWNMTLLFAIGLSAFVVMLYIPTLFFKTKNPYTAFIVMLQDLFSKKFFKTLGIYLLIIFINTVISIFLAVFSSNIIMHFIFTLINFYFITAVAVGIFYYYQKEFVKSHLGKYIDTEV